MSTPNGPGYASPLDAFRSTGSEKLLYVVCIVPESTKRNQPDYLAVVDVDTSSSTYSKVIHRTYMPYVGDELHHFGWNSCSSCYNNPNRKRNRIILPALGSNRIYVLNVNIPETPFLEKVIDAEQVGKLGVSAMHTAHCSPTNEIIISTMGDENGNGKGNFVLLDGDTLTLKGLWATGKSAKFGYDFWYQPYHDVLIASEWGSPSSFRCGFNLEDTRNKDVYGQSLNVYSWSKRTLLQTIDLGDDGIAPLEIRFLHDPKADQGYVGCALNSNIFRFFLKSDGKWAAEKVIDVPAKKVTCYETPEINGMITDILISMDDKYLYFTNWLHGDVRQYDITDTSFPKLVGQIFLGGKLLTDSSVKVIHDPEGKSPQKPIFLKGRRLYGSPQMIQLSLDGKRLYVTTSLYSPWDKQIYPETIKTGATMVKLNVNTETGGLTLDPNFLIDFGQEPNGPVFAHECRYPGGDCTSDIFLADCCFN